MANEVRYDDYKDQIRNCMEYRETRRAACEKTQKDLGGRIDKRFPTAWAIKTISTLIVVGIAFAGYMLKANADLDERITEMEKTIGIIETDIEYIKASAIKAEETQEKILSELMANALILQKLSDFQDRIPKIKIEE